MWAVETVLFEEDFEDVTLKSSIMEQIKNKKVWSGTPPEGWEITNENPKDLGMPEWRTWTIVDLDTKTNPFHIHHIVGDRVASAILSRIYSFYSIKSAERSCDNTGVCQLYNKE